MNKLKLSLKNQQGFTLIELMIALVVLAVLMAIAIPSFTQQIQRSQMRSTMADFITAVAYARSQAVSRSTNIHVLSRADSTDWGDGWCVTTDATACGTPEGAGGTDATLLRSFEGPGAISVTGEGTTKVYSFNQQGYLADDTLSDMSISLCGSSGKGKKIEILPLGQALAQECECVNDACTE